MDRTYVENAIRIVKFKIGDKVDLKPVCGHFTEDMDQCRKMFEDFFMININEKTIDLYYKSLIQARNRIYQKDKDLKITKSQWIVDLFK